MRLPKKTNFVKNLQTLKSSGLIQELAISQEKFRLWPMKSTSRRLFWVAFLYFYSGIPLGFFYTFLPVYLRTQGVDLVTIGFVSSAGIFWSLKPLWAPLLDRYSYKAFWLLLSLSGLSLVFISLCFVEPTSSLLVLPLLALTLFSALYDTALDGLLIEYISKEALGRANGVRLTFYRLALIFAGGLGVALSEYLSFKTIFIFFSSLCALGGFLIFGGRDIWIRLKKEVSLSIIQQYYEPLKDLYRRERFIPLILFIATYKIGDALLGGMVYPFWVDMGFSKVEIGFISGTLGVIFTILGSLLGGYYTERLGLKRALFIMGFLQAFSNLGYTFVAHPSVHKKLIYGASIVESFTGGLGTAAFLTFLTGLCSKEFSASQYALFSTLFSLTLVLSRTLSGFGAKSLGYFLFFGLTFLIALLPLLLIPFSFKKDKR